MKQPHLQVLFEDAHLIVCRKPPGTATQSGRIGEPDMVSLIKNHLHEAHPENGEPYLAVIHRLDQPVSGLLVFAKTPFAARELNRQLTQGGFGKHYRALVDGTPPRSGAPWTVLENYLVKDSRTNTSRICGAGTPGAKPARLRCRTVGKGQGIFAPLPGTTELDIRLDTGRHHQIRVQLAGAGCPIVGDARYNPRISGQKKEQGICLCAYRLAFRHPKTGRDMCFALSPDDIKDML